MGNKSIGQSFISASLKNARNLRKRFPENDDKYIILPGGNFQFKNLVFEISSPKLPPKPKSFRLSFRLSVI